MVFMRDLGLVVAVAVTHDVSMTVMVVLARF
jgi:hypothetical protein